MSKCKVVFFGAGGYAEDVFGVLNKKYAPVAYGDNDPKKHGARFMGLPVLSLEEIEAGYPDCLFFVTVNELTMPFVITSLLDGGVAPSRIINYAESKKYKSCIYLETLLFYDRKNLSYCCSDFGKNKSPCVITNGLSYEEQMKAFIDTRDRIIDELNLHSSESNTLNQCKGCCNLRNAFYYSDRRIRNLNINFRTVCNFKCSYCKSYHGKVDDTFETDVDETLSFLHYLKNECFINNNTEIHLTAGEITVHPLREKILAELQHNPCIIYSNASAYNETIGKMLSSGRSKLFVSIDAGTRGTFAKVKGVDFFDKVCANLVRYSLDGFVHLKYIVLPGVNDGELDMEGFIDLCRRLKVRVVDVSRDMHDTTPFCDRTIDMIARLLIELQKLGVRALAQDYSFSEKVGEQQRIGERLAELERDISTSASVATGEDNVLAHSNASADRATLGKVCR